MADPKGELTALLSNDIVWDDPQQLEGYSGDESFTPRMKPGLVVKPANVDQVQKIVGWANRTNTPLVPLSSGPPHSHGDTIPGVPGAVIVDLSSMKKISNIERRNRLVVVEPGVTYNELLPALAKEGLRLSIPLLPRPNKSVLASLLEREPRLNARYQWSSMEPLRCTEIVFGDGNKLWSGGSGNDAPDLQKQWDEGKRPVDPTGPSQTDFYRLLSASQGSIGIATWASLKCEVLPRVHKIFFVAAKALNDLLDFTYRILKYRYADELFILNNTSLACILGGDDALKSQLPNWVTVVGLAGRDELPDERVEYQYLDIAEIARGFGLELKDSIPGGDSARLLELFTGKAFLPSWKLSPRGGCQDFFFITTLDKTPGFWQTMQSSAEAAGYPAADIGVYIQPRHQGVNCHCEFVLPYDPSKAVEASRLQSLYSSASVALLRQGAFYTRPYGIWADMAFAQDPATTRLLQRIKQTFDPNGIMNPGKLCFKVNAREEK